MARVDTPLLSHCARLAPFVLLGTLLAPGIASLLTPSRLAAQASTGAIVGEVVRAGGGGGLEGARVSLEPGGATVITGQQGEFRFVDLAAGEYRLRVELAGVEPEERSVRVRAGERANPTVELQVSAILLEELQVTATRSRRSTFDVPAPVSVVGREELARRQPTKVGEIFAELPGVEIEGAGPFLGLPVIRGLSGNRVLVLVDGQRLNNAREAINFGGVQPSLVDVERIAEVEILRGPASVLYGSDALGGIVNIVTRKPPHPSQGLETGGSFTSRYSSVDDGRTFSGDLRLATPRFSLRFGGSWREAENYSSPEGTVVNSGAESLDLSADAEYRLTDEQALTLKLQRFDADDVGLPGTSGVFTGFFPSTDREKLSLEYRGEALPAVGSLRVEAWVQDQEENFATTLDVPPFEAGPFQMKVDAETERISDVRTVGFGIRGETSPASRHRITYGVDFFRDDVEEDRLEETVTQRVPMNPGPPPQTDTVLDTAPTTPEASFQGLGIFIQDEIEVGPLQLVPGIRFDRFDLDSDPLERPEGDLEAQDRSEEAVSGSFSVLYRATSHLHPTVSFGRAFRTPNVIERFFFGPGSQGGLTVPNPDLDNETSLNVDAGVKIRYPSFQGSVTYFHNRVKDFITFRSATFQGDSTVGGQPVSQVQNVGTVRIQGVEAFAEYLIPTGLGRWIVSAGFSYTDGEDLESDEPLFVPPTKGTLGVRWTDPSGSLSLGLRGRAVDRQDEVPTGFDETAGFGVVDLQGSVALEPWTGWDVTLDVALDNVADKLYREPLNAAAAPGRNFRISLRTGLGGLR